MLLFCSYTQPLSPAFLTLGNHWYLLHLYHFVISGMLHKWNHTVRELLSLAVFTQHNIHEVHPSFLSVSIVHAFCWCSILLYEYTTVYLPIHPLKDIWIISRFWPLQIKLWTFMYRFLYDNKFPFLCDKCPRVQLLDHMVSTSLVLWETETAILFFGVAVPFYILNSNSWVI